MLPGSNSSVESIRSQQQSFVDKSPYFEDLNASFKLLFKSIQNKRDLFESGFKNTINNNNNNNINSNPLNSNVANNFNNQTTLNGMYEKQLFMKSTNFDFINIILFLKNQHLTR